MINNLKKLIFIFIIVVISLNWIYICVASEAISEPIDEGINVIGYEFIMMENVVSTNPDSVPYGTDKIHVRFNKELLKESVGNKFSFLAEPNDGQTIPITCELLTDACTVEIDMGDYLFDENSTYTLTILSGLEAVDGTVLNEDIKEDLITNDESVSVITTEYFKESFDDFVSDAEGTRFPDGWFRIATGGVHIPDTGKGIFAESGSSGSDEDVSIRMGSNTIHQRIMTPFTTYVPLGGKVYVDVDVYRGGKGGFYINMLPEPDLTASATDHNFDANLTIGMHPSSAQYPSNANRSTAPKLGYAPAVTSSTLKSFVDNNLKEGQEGYNCLVEAGEWHKIHMEVEPKSAEETILRVSVDGGKEFVQSTKLNFYTQQMAGIALMAMRPLKDATTMEENQDIRFDNIRVYSMADIKVPKAIRMTARDDTGKVYSADTPISSLCSEFDIEFDTAIDDTDLADKVKLICGDKEIPATLEIINGNTTVRLRPSEVIEPGQSYKILIAEGIASEFSERMKSKEPQVLYFRTLDDGIFEFLGSNLAIENSVAVYSAEFFKTVDTDKEYLIAVAEYCTVEKTENGATKSYDKMLNVEYQKISFDIDKYGNIVNQISLDVSGTGEIYKGFLFEIPGNKCVASKTIQKVNNVVKEYPLTEDAYVRQLGRGEVVAGRGRSYNWPNAGFEFVFDGSRVEVYVPYSTYNDSGEDFGPFFNISVDGIKPIRVKLTSGWNTLVENLEDREHTITVTRSSEGIRGLAYMSAIRLTGDGTDPFPTEAKSRRMEFYGDSYTVGYGNLGVDGDSYTASNTDNGNAYSLITARAFDADANIIAYSGKGVLYNDNGVDRMLNNLSTQFFLADIKTGYEDHSTWDFSKYTPDVVVVFLGRNDYVCTTYHNIGTADEVEDAYKVFLQNIRQKYPDSKIICCSRPDGGYKELVGVAVDELMDPNIHTLVFQEPFPTGGVGQHPNVAGHAVIAEQLIKKVSEITGWECK